MSRRISAIWVIVLLAGFPKAVLADSLMLFPYDFHPEYEDTDFMRSGADLHMLPTSTNTSFYAPVHLPQNAKITSVVVFYYDDSGSGSLFVGLQKKNLYTKADTFMADWSSTGQLPSDQIHKISPVVGGNSIDNGGYAYWATVDFSDPAQETLVKLYAVKIIYSTT